MGVDKSSYDDAARRLVVETLEKLDALSSLTCGKETFEQLRRQRLALYVHLASNSQIALEDVTDDHIATWEVAVSHAVDAAAHARAYRALCEQAVIDHPGMLAQLYALVHGADVFASLEVLAADWFQNAGGVHTPPPTHASSETRH